VVPEVNGLLDNYRESYKFVNRSRGTWERATDAVASKIHENERAAAAMEEDEAKGRPIIGGRRLTPGVANTQRED
jgi:hypothetical protein